MIVRSALIRKLRERFNFSQVDLASASKVSLATIIKVEQGHVPTLSVLEAIAKAFHVDYRDFLVPPHKVPNNDAICKLIVASLDQVSAGTNP